MVAVLPEAEEDVLNSEHVLKSGLKGEVLQFHHRLWLNDGRDTASMPSRT